MAKSMAENKAVKMLKAAEVGGYGVIGVVSVYQSLIASQTNYPLIYQVVQS